MQAGKETDERGTKMNTINLTPHAIVIGQLSFLPSGRTLRLIEADTSEVPVCGIPVIRRRYHLPELAQVAPVTPDTIYIVSAIALPYCSGRSDIFAPDTGSGAVRDAAGCITGTTRLIAAPEAK